MAGPFFFAIVGGITDPAFSTTTTGDVWGGSIQTWGDVWGGELVTQGTIAEDSNVITNIENVENLIVGNTYFLTGPGIPLNQNGTPLVTTTYTGGTSVTMSQLAEATSAPGTIKFINSSQVTTVSNLGSTAQLVIGQVYAVSGAGIQPGTTTTFGGSSPLTLSLPATQTSKQTRIVLSTETGSNIIKNLGSTSGLVSGQTYNIWGPGIPAATSFTYASGTSITITAEATISNTGVYLSISKGITEDDGGDFDTSTMLVEDLEVFEFGFSHTEGNFPTLKAQIDVKSLGGGLLPASGQQWLWVSWDSAWQSTPGYTTNPANVVPLFHGRIVGVAQQITEEIVTLQFVARPLDFFVQKQTIAETLQVPPTWDPLFVQKKLADPDTALEAMTVAWHIDPRTLEVSTSDFINAEDGQITIEEEDHFYDGVDGSYREAPLTSVSVEATVTWTQAGTGDVDLTSTIVSAFQAAGSPFGWPNVGSLTSAGLLSSWPQPGANFGGGWTMSIDSIATDASAYVTAYNYNMGYPAPNSSEGEVGVAFPNNPVGGPNSIGGLATKANWNVSFNVNPIGITFSVTFDASRRRSEVLAFNLQADVQSVLIDPGTSETEILQFSSSYVDQPIDPGNALPIGDVRRNAYFTTDRGQQSIQYLLSIAAARLIERARCIEIKFICPWKPPSGANLLGITCRQSVLLQDRRLPGGQAIGKVVGYEFTASGTGGGSGMVAEVTIACAVGNGNTLPAASSGTDVYATGYSTGYTQTTPGSAQVDVVAGVLQYTSLDGTVVIDDDGVDLFNMVPSTVVSSLTIFNGMSDQVNTANQGAQLYGDPVGAIKAAPTQVDLEMIPVAGGDFYTPISLGTMPLQIPKMIDLSQAVTD